MNNSTLIPGQCPLVDPITWHPSFANKAANISNVCAVVVQVLMIPFVVFFNVVTIWIVVKFETMQEQRFVVLGLLSLTDLLSGLVSQPVFVARELYHLSMQEVNCSLDSAYYVSTLLFSTASFYQLTCLTYERYVAITDPFRYQDVITVRRLLYVSLANWVIHLILVVVFGTILSVKSHILIIAIPIVLLFCITYWYIKIFKIVRSQNRSIGRIQVESVPNEASLRNYLKNRKSAITSVCLVAAFGLTYLPVFAEITVTYNVGASIRGPVFFAIHSWINIFLHSGSLLSPLLYGIRTEEFRSCFRRLFGIKARNIEPQVPKLVLATPQMFLHHQPGTDCNIVE